MHSIVRGQGDVVSATSPRTLYPKKEYASALTGLAEALLKRQRTDVNDPNMGGIWCEFCHVWHTRAAESVYPFAVTYGITGDRKYLSAAENAAAWLIRQQQPNGSWKETPEEWTGTTTDQLLMMLLAYEKIGSQLDAAASASWSESMKKAAAYLAAVMRPEFASINYVATTTATLAKAGLFFNNREYLRLARDLAHRVVSKMDDDGFLDGEGGRSHTNKMGVDLGYEMEMSLWGLGLYARLAKDSLVDGYVKRALKNHLWFIYPDGSLDGSWGIRSNKWTGYGGATSDGCQVLFALYADEDPRYTTASLRNLHFLLGCKSGDLIGYGPQHAEVFTTPPCIYPTFAKAKNLAMAYELETRATRPAAALPADKTGWVKVFPTLDVIEVRTACFMATITGYRYKDPAGTKGKYMYRPDGGTLSHVWLKGQGFLQASSPTMYTRPEPMSFPEAPGILSLTPRIEYADSTGYFTNLYEYDSRMRVGGESPVIDITGELKDKNFLTGGVRYNMHYVFGDRSFEKTIRLTYHDASPVIRIIEPFIDSKDMTFERKDAHTIQFTTPQRKILFQLVSGDAELVAGKDASHYWTPYPALRAIPIELMIKPPAKGFANVVRYRVTVVEKEAAKSAEIHFY
jgi:hypothetical protein